MSGPWEQFQLKAAADDAKPWEQFQPKPASRPFGEQLNDFVADVPRILGRSARVGIQAAGGFVNLAASPFRAALNAVTPDVAPSMQDLVAGTKPGPRFAPIDFRGVADSIGLPRPRPGMESVADSAAETVAGAAGGMGIAKFAGSAAEAALALRAQQVANRTASAGRLAVAGEKFARGTVPIAELLASNPGQQLASAGAAGAAGGYTRETGGNETSQLLASLAAGAAAPFAMSGAAKIGQAAGRLRTPPAPSPVQVDITINNAIESSGLSLSQLPQDVAAGIRADVAKAMQLGERLNPDAIRRLADYRTIGATPTHGSLVRTPAAFTQQKNLTKLGVNSKDEAAQALANVEDSNNATLIKTVNGVGANTADDAYAGGQKIIGGVQGYDDRANSVIGKLYAKARASDGRSAALDPHAFTQRAGNLLNEANVESFLTPDIRNKLNQFAGGQVPLNVDIAEQLKTSIGAIQRGSTDGNVRKALGLVRQALDDTPLQAGQEIGAGAQMAFNRARTINRNYMQIVEKTPALQAVRDGIEPDAFVQKFIVGGGGKAQAMDVAMLKNSIKSDPVALEAVKEQIALHLKSQALTGKSDEVGRFSESAFNKAYKAIGERKMRLFFDAGEIDQMKAAGRVASYEQVQPVGSAVNNSNTASTGMSALIDRFGSSPFMSKFPGGHLLAAPAQNISIGIKSGRTMDAPRALLDGRAPLLPPPVPRGLMISPAALMGTETEEQRRRREAGLLLP